MKRPYARRPDPASMDLLFKTAVSHHQAGRLQQAEVLYRELVQISPDHADICHLLGVTLCQMGRNATGLELVDRAIRLKPDFAEAYSNRGIALQRLGQYQEAVASFDKAILLKPELADAYKNRGFALNQSQQYQAAVASFDQAILLKPDAAEAYCNRGNALTELQQYQAAIESFDKAVMLQPNYAEAYCNRGNALMALQQYHAVIENCEHVIRIRPGSGEAYYNRGVALHGLQQYQAAIESFDQAIRIHPAFAEAYCNRGLTLYGLQQYQAAQESFAKTLLLNPKHEYVLGMLIRTQQLMCCWENLEAQCKDLEALLDRNAKVAPPFTVLGISGSPDLQRKAAEIYMRNKCPSRSSVEVIPMQPRHDRICIGYFSADFRNHAVCCLMAELFERHDRRHFEIIGFSFGRHAGDQMQTRVTAAMDRMLDVRALSDQAIAQLSRELNVDIAVDLMGFTKDARPGILAGRVAPIQVSYLGYPGTMGADYIDYLIADSTLIPESSQRHYAEKIVYLPDSFQANDSTVLPSTKTYTRGEEGLPEEGFVYCCFNNSYKITPATFDLWMRILGQVKGSVLWLLESNPWVAENLRKEAARRGISPKRLVFSGNLPLSDHLARLPLADLFLDTLPFNAGATASPSLWAGLPLLTCMGEALASRMGASLLRAIGLPELVTTTRAAYEVLAVELALDTARYQEIRERLQRNRLTTPLFDVPGFTRHLEAAYRAMYERYQAALPPDHLYIPGGQLFTTEG